MNANQSHNTYMLHICRDKNNRKVYETQHFNTQNTLKFVKRTILQGFGAMIPLDKAKLIWYDHRDKHWYSFTDDQLDQKLEITPLRDESFVSIETTDIALTKLLNTIKSLDTAKILTLKLCVKPMHISRTISIKVSENITMRDLRELIYGKFNWRAKESPVFVSSGSYWKKYIKISDNESVQQLKIIDGSYISTEEFNGSYTFVEPGLCGLRNMGNTCYMNSALQCLFHISEFMKVILNDSNEITSPILSDFIKLSKDMWAGSDSSLRPSNTLDMIIDMLPQYNGYTQQDAQEFMNHFLHLIDYELTGTHSIIKDLFYGQTQSLVMCNNCQHIFKTESSISFLPLAIDSEAKWKIRLIKLYGEQIIHCIPQTDEIVTVRHLIQHFLDNLVIDVNPKNIRAINLFDNEFSRYIDNETYIHEIGEELNLIELPSSSFNQKIILCEFVDDSTLKKFRPPVALCCSKLNPMFLDMEEQLQNTIGHFCSVADVPMSAVTVKWTDTQISYNYHKIDINNDYNRKLPYIEKVQLQCESLAVKRYCEQMNASHSQNDFSLTSLMNSFFQENNLEDGYKCNQCHKTTIAKQSTRLCSPLPPVLIIQLKRFRYLTRRREKIDRFINFPLKDLNLKNYLIEPEGTNGDVQSSTAYDLVAVSNHIGELNAGHYTTYAKYSVDDRWYLFDDSFVRELLDSESPVTKNAYILVYVRKN